MFRLHHFPFRRVFPFVSAVFAVSAISAFAGNHKIFAIPSTPPSPSPPPPPLISDALRIAESAIASSSPSSFVSSAVNFSFSSGTLRVVGADGSPKFFTFGPNGKFDFAVLFAVGKAAMPMAEKLAEIFPKEILREGLIVSPGGLHSPPQSLPPSFRHLQSSHPIPTEHSVNSAKDVLSTLQKYSSNPRCLILFGLSGGSSSLLCLPPPPLSLGVIQQVTKALLSCGANINEINCIRKHLSEISGGRVGALRGDASLISLILSDVVGDSLSAIGSGPTVPDESTFLDAFEVLQKYPSLQKTFPREVIKFLLDGAKGEKSETPKNLNSSNDSSEIHNFLIGNNKKTLMAAENTAKSMGYHTKILTDTLTGEARDAAEFLVSEARNAEREVNGEGEGEGSDGKTLPIALFSGGETTVNLNSNGNNGLGGRNQEMALAAAIELQRTNPKGNSMTPPNIAFLSVGTDGIDGPTDAAGAVVTNKTLQEANALGCLGNPSNSLNRHDSYGFFDGLDKCIQQKGINNAKTHIKIGPTGTNVMDIQVILIDRIDRGKGKGSEKVE